MACNDQRHQLLDISIHNPGPDDLLHSRVQKRGHRLKVIRDVPDVETYVQLEMKEPQRSVAVTGTCFPGILVTNADIS